MGPRDNAKYPVFSQQESHDRLISCPPEFLGLCSHHREILIRRQNPQIGSKQNQWHELGLGILPAVYPSSILDYLEQQLPFRMCVRLSAIRCVLAILAEKLAEDAVDE
jgi:hypothetical protein